MKIKAYTIAGLCLSLLTASVGGAAADSRIYQSYPFYAKPVAAARVRSGPGSNFNELLILQRGQLLKVTQCQNNFCEVTMTDQRTGWITWELLVEVPAPPNAEPAIVQQPQLDTNRILSPKFDEPVQILRR